MDTTPPSSEQWRPIVGFEGWYEVSDQGRVRRVRSGPHTRVGYVLKPAVRRGGYLMVAMQRLGGRREAFVHRLVAEMFIGSPGPGQQVNHKNGQKSDNRVANLEWVTCGDNHRHAYRTGLRSRTHRGLKGTTNPRAKLTPAAVQAIREARGKVSQTVLAHQFGVVQSVISAIQRREIWTDV